MKKLLYILFIPLFGQAQYKTGKDLIISLHNKTSAKPCQTLAFKQTTSWPEDTTRKSMTWTEYLEYPDKLRIEFGDSAKGNYVVFKNDSAFRHKNFTLVNTSQDKNLIMLLLGGMYFRTLPDVLERMKEAGIDLNAICTQTRNGKTYYAVGTKEINDTVPQIWFDKKTLLLESFFEKSKDAVMQVVVAERKPACGTAVETKLRIYLNRKLYQEELYYDIKTGTPIPKGKFETKK
jgi:hypothetical protein